jgi:phosphoribosylaminoimidazolecarboxamide formyltransferase / IMP cyclohydrolase
MQKPIKTALISVSDKAGVEDFCRFLVSQNVRILSTGGTANLLREKNIPVTDVSDHTGFPEMLDGRVKTLHPKVHGGLLGRRGDAGHVAAMAQHGIENIDLLVVNLYPFEATVARGAGVEECIENIDIGGPAMIRSAAKNHEDVTVIVCPEDYAVVSEQMLAHAGATTLELRRRLAGKAYARTAAYDSAISMWFAQQQGELLPERFAIAASRVQALRYGENPHQQAGFYAWGNTQGTLASARQVQGKELSYNNINDTDAAWALVQEFADPTVVIVKHANPCGVATGANMVEAYQRAFSCDAQSAFGGIIALNRTLDVATAEAISAQFAEVIIAPDADDAALALMAKKKNLRLLLAGSGKQQASLMVKAVSGGLLIQDADALVLDESLLKVVSKRQPTPQEMLDMRFAFAVGKHVKSNAIVIAREGMTVGIGAGQMSRVDSVRIACWKAGEANLGTQGAVLASDAFFPFDDNVHAAAKAGITALIHPGGSIRDDEVIKAADEYGMAMVMTGLRHFRH